MIESKTIEIIVHKTNKKYYNQLGYNCNVNDLIKVKVEDLPLSTKTKILIKCDYCGEIIERAYNNYIKQTQKDIIHKDACIKCAAIKRKESNLLKYGVENCMQLPDVQDKQKNTMLKKYGVEHQMQLDSTKNKIKQTNLNKYGKESALQNEEIKEKIKQTNLLKYGEVSYTKTKEFKERVIKTNLNKYGVQNVMQDNNIKSINKQSNINKYGVENVFMLDEIKEKIKNTNIKKYGVYNPMKNEEIKNKSVLNRIKSFYNNNNNILTSKQQIYLHSLLGGQLNYPVEQFNLDIAFPNEKIYIEYNGGGHDLAVKVGRLTEEQLKRMDMKRYFILKNLGWKQICIISPRDYLAEDNIILKEIITAKNYLLSNKSEHSHYNIIFSENIFDPYFGKLRKINSFISP